MRDFGERVGGLSECVKVALRRSVSAGSLSFAGLLECVKVTLLRRAAAGLGPLRPAPAHSS